MTPATIAGIDARLAAVLPANSLYAVGGRVRDEVRAVRNGVAPPVKDLDYVVTGIELTALVDRLRSIGSADVVGASFAVVKATLGGVTVDVALPRRERSTGTGHRDFAVEAGPGVSLADDLARRDFRMNMLARALPGGPLVDPYGGVADIRAGRVDVLRPTAFAEDPLRMLRACQFAARFAYAIAPATMAAMVAAAPSIVTVSAERVRDELMKMLAAPSPSLGFEAMRAAGLLAAILPELAEGSGVEQNVYHAYDVFRHNLAALDAADGDLVSRLAAVLHDCGKPRCKDGPHFYGHDGVGADLAAALLDRLHFPAAVRDDVVALVRNHMYLHDPNLSPKAIRRFVRRVGPERVERQFALRRADVVASGLPRRGNENERFEERVRTIVAERPPLSVAELAVSGLDAIEALVAAGALPPGSRGGPAVGRVLAAALEAVLDDPRRNERTTLLAFVRERAKQERRG